MPVTRGAITRCVAGQCRDLGAMIHVCTCFLMALQSTGALRVFGEYGLCCNATARPGATPGASHHTPRGVGVPANKAPTATMFPTGRGASKPPSPRRCWRKRRAISLLSMRRDIAIHQRERRQADSPRRAARRRLASLPATSCTARIGEARKPAPQYHCSARASIDTHGGL